MKISFVIEAFKGGGKERRCLQLIQGLNKRGFKDIQLIIINSGMNDVAFDVMRTKIETLLKE